MYYTVINDNGGTCGHKHRKGGRALDCYDRIADNHLYSGREPKPIIIRRNDVDLETAGFVWLAWEKYGKGETLQAFADKWLN